MGPQVLPTITYSVTSPISPISSSNAVAIQTASQNSANTTAIFSSLVTSTNLSISANNAQSSLTSSVANAQANMNSKTSVTKGSTTNQLNSAKGTISSSFATLASSLPIASLQTTTTTYFATANKYDTYRYCMRLMFRVYGQLALVLAYLIPICLIMISGALKRPEYMKGLISTL